MDERGEAEMIRAGHAVLPFGRKGERWRVTRATAHHKACRDARCLAGPGQSPRDLVERRCELTDRDPGSAYFPAVLFPAGCFPALPIMETSCSALSLSSSKVGTVSPAKPPICRSWVD
jgi:hypothetical protein